MENLFKIDLINQNTISIFYMNQQAVKQEKTEHKADPVENSNSNIPPVVEEQAQKAPTDKVPSRKIPDTLIQSYDLVSLKEDKKKRFQAIKNNTEVEEETSFSAEKLLQIQGECLCRFSSEQEFQAVYRLTPGLIVISKQCHIKIKTITKIKLKSEDSIDEKTKVEEPRGKIVKITWEQNQQEKNIQIKTKTWLQAYYLFSAIITRKLLIEDFVLHDSSNKFQQIENSIKKIEGDYFMMNCLKISTQVSNYFRKWEKKRLRINQENIQIFKEDKLLASIRGIKELWTRFTMNNGYFVIKMHHGMQKTEVGVPLVDFTNISSERNCLFLFCRHLK